jgi:type IV pilus assembly protein PilA
MKQTTQKGFTLLEILLVVAAIAILAGIVIIAINPTKQLADTRNAQRWSNVNSILNAVYQYSIDNKGLIPVSIATTSKNICSSASSTVCAGLGINFADLTALTNNQTYLTAIPTDPSSSTATDSGYDIFKSANGRITVYAPITENFPGTTTISVTR